MIALRFAIHTTMIYLLNIQYSYKTSESYLYTCESNASGLARRKIPCVTNGGNKNLLSGMFAHLSHAAQLKKKWQLVTWLGTGDSVKEGPSRKWFIVGGHIHFRSQSAETFVAGNHFQDCFYVRNL